MSVPPRPANVVRALAVSLLILVAALMGALFGVPMEAVAPAAGVVTSSSMSEIRARQSGLVDVRVQAGSELTSGQEFAVIRTEENGRLSDYWRDLFPEALREQGRPEAQLLTAPAERERWLVLDVRVTDGQRVHAGDLIAVLAPVDPLTHRVLDLCVRLEFDERRFGGVSPGQTVRISSAMYNYRLFGTAKGSIERLEPMGVEGDSGTRRFFALARLEESPFELKIGASVNAEVITGRRRLVRIILDH